MQFCFSRSFIFGLKIYALNLPERERTIWLGFCWYWHEIISVETLSQWDIEYYRIFPCTGVHNTTEMVLLQIPVSKTESNEYDTTSYKRKFL